MGTTIQARQIHSLGINAAHVILIHIQNKLISSHCRTPFQRLEQVYHTLFGLSSNFLNLSKKGEAEASPKFL